MIQTNQIYIPIPKARNTKIKVEVNGDDVTGRTIESTWTKPVTVGIGTFRIKLSNAHGQLTGLYQKGQVAKLFADNSNATTLQFWGRIDFVKDDISEKGQFLEIEGRHRSFLLTEFLVCYSTEDSITSDILEDIIDQLPTSYGITKNNLNADTTTMSVEWNYKPFWDCVVELCNKAGFDAYVDDDLDFHYFEENSIENTTDAIVEGDTLISTQGFGTDDYGEKTRVTVIGQDSSGLPIVYTEISPTEGNEIRELFFRDNTSNTFDKVKNSAEAKLAEFSNKNPQATMKSHGLESPEPGENIWVIIPRQKISGLFKMLQITHRVGMNVGGWRTEIIIEEEVAEISKTIRNLNRDLNISTTTENVNKFNYSQNFDFEDDSGTHSSTQIADGFLSTDGSDSGTWESPTTSAEIDSATSFELRVAGERTNQAIYSVSTKGGASYQQVTGLNTPIDFALPGKDLKIRIQLLSAEIRIESICLLYK